LEEQKKQCEASSFQAEVKAKPHLHKLLIGKQGSEVRRIKDATGARVIFPSDQVSPKNTFLGFI